MAKYDIEYEVQYNGKIEVEYDKANSFDSYKIEEEEEEMRDRII